MISANTKVRYLFLLLLWLLKRVWNMILAIICLLLSLLPLLLLSRCMLAVVLCNLRLQLRHLLPPAALVQRVDALLRAIDDKVAPGELLVPLFGSVIISGKSVIIHASNAPCCS